MGNRGSIVAKLGEIITSIALGDGESVVVKIDPSAEIGETVGKQGGRTFHVPVTLENGKSAVLTGGVRLIDSLQALGTLPTGQTKLRVTALGAAGSTARNWKIRAE